ncbi:hypothetical protein [Pseudomonas sp. LD120]|uniref:hypothetical protein n=1 Tax=Pseudomonas sp. LD120 TaxID=485751 RepID=UPI00353186BA
MVYTDRHRAVTGSVVVTCPTDKTITIPVGESQASVELHCTKRRIGWRQLL